MTDLLSRVTTALADRYRIVRELGRGGMALVYLAEDLRHRRRVAIKVLRPELAASLGPDRFLREIEIAARLEHPHILTLIDSGAVDDLLFFVMPFLEGESLRARLAREGRLPVIDAARLFREIVDALAHAHRAGVVHRDMKPDNVLLSGRHAVITDFGVAKALTTAGGATTTVGMTVGTPAYMAPEQAAADPGADHRVDIYAAAVVAYEMLAGTPPFEADTPQAVLAAHVTTPPEPIAARRAEVPEALAAIIMQGLEKTPGARWGSADELLERLDAVVAGIETTPEGHTPVEVPAHRRRRWVLALSAVAVASALIGLFAVLPTRGSAPADVDRPTIVVLPFENIGGADNEYFADGITQEITSQLGAIPSLGVVARTSAIQYRGTTKPATQIGEELGVRYILSGAVQWQRAPGGQDRVRITPTLVRADDGTQVWTQRYDDVLADVFKVQSDVASEVARALDVTLGARRAPEAPPTANLDAYDLFLQANLVYWRGFDEAGFLRAGELYQRAVALDPSFAHAWAMLSQVHSQIHWFGFDATERRMTRAYEAAQRALELAPDLAEGHIALGRYYYGLRDYDRAQEQFLAARAITPSDAGLIYQIANVHRRTGRLEDALAAYREGFRLDQRNATIAHSVGATAMYLRRYDEAQRGFALATVIQPDWGHPRVYAIYARLLASGDARAAASEMKALAAARSPAAVVTTVDDIWPWWIARMLVAADSALASSLTPEYFGVDRMSFLLAQAEVATLRGAEAVARAWYDSVAAQLADTTLRLPVAAIRPSLNGVALAGLGRPADAVREATRATEMLPVARDALWGAAIKENLALVHARVGNPDRAVALLGELLGAPGFLSPRVLAIDPAWESLRGHTGFRRLVGMP